MDRDTMYDLSTKRKLLAHLMGFITKDRQQKFNHIVKFRTRYITVVVEDLFQPHNASAVLRSCDCFGIQDVHIIENRNKFEINSEIALGSSKWLTIKTHKQEVENTGRTIKYLKEQGYRVVATTPHQDEVLLPQSPINHKVALLFGTEKEGLSQEALMGADIYMKIPMFGFTESFNISVSAAIILNHLTQKLHASDVDWQLSNEEETDVLLQWARNSINRSEIIERNFIEKLE